jgi:hypothetical protein
MSNTNRQTKGGTSIAAALFIIAFAVAFSSTYNPANFRRMHVDSSVYMTIAQGITRGQLPYRDFVDNKGPLAYFLSVPGLLLGGFTGVWITELVLLCVSVFFAYKTALFFGNRKIALAGTACAFAAFLSFFTVCAGTEEYSLPFLMAALYVFTRYFFSERQNADLLELAALGAAFACAVLIRLNMFPLWAGFCAVIFVEAALKRRFALLGKSVAGFCAGVIAVGVPVFLYLNANGILGAFVDQVIRGGVAKGFSGSDLKETVKNFYILLNRGYSFVPLFWGGFALITKHRQARWTFYAAYTFSYILALLFLSFSSGDSHYNAVLIPFFVPACTSITAGLYAVLSSLPAAKRRAAFVLCLCLVFSESLMKYLDDLAEMFHNDSGAQLIRAGAMIDENTRPGDTIISLGINGYIYPFTKRAATSKYIYQGSGIDLLPGAREAFLSDIAANKPAVIAIFSADDGRYDYLPDWYAPVYAMIASDYRLLSDENGYYLFIRNDSMPTR